MTLKRRETSYTGACVSTILQPELKKKPRTAYATPEQLSFREFPIRKRNQLQQYVRLTLKSLEKNYPVSELKPFSTYHSVDKIQESIKHKDHQFRPSYFQRKKKTFDKIFTLQSRKESSRNQTIKNSTFYQTKRNSKKNKIRYNTTINFNKTRILDEEEHMVVEFIKQDKEVTKKQKNVFESVNDLIKQQYPKHFQPSFQHDESKCHSSSCKQGFFKRKKYCVKQKYEMDQPGFARPQVKKPSNKKKNYKENTSFCMFSRSRNKIISTQNTLPQKEQINENLTTLPFEQMSVSLRQKFKNQSAAVYKKYMRSSFHDRKKTLMEDMNVKIQ